MGYLRLTIRLAGFSTALIATALLASSLTLMEAALRRPLNRSPWARACFRSAALSLGFRLSIEGHAIRGPVLFVSNHISWSDIPILGGIAPLRFLSKSEVREWPAIGWLAAQAGTLFIKRGSGKAGRSREEIAAALARGESVLVFPEGTTTAGITVLPFHSRLLHAAVDAGVPIQPVSIGYLREGQPDHIAPFIGDDEFQHHLIRVLRVSSPRVEVRFHPPVMATAETDMAGLAARLRNQVADGLADIHRDDSRTPEGLGRAEKIS